MGYGKKRGRLLRRFFHVDNVSLLVMPDAGHEVFDEEKSSSVRSIDRRAWNVDGVLALGKFLKIF